MAFRPRPIGNKYAALAGVAGAGDPAVSFAPYPHPWHIVLFLIGLRMIFPPADGIMGETPDGEPFIVPLAIPCVAGPSSMATLMLLGASHPDSQGVLLAALGLAWAGNLAVILGAVLLLRYLGKRLLIALERLMGMLLVTLSVQLFLDGVARYLGG